MTQETITLKSDHGKFVTAEDGGGNQGAIVADRPAGLATANREAAAAWEQITILPLDDTYVAFQSCGGQHMPPKFACAEGGGETGQLVFNRDEAGPWESFLPVRLGEKIAFQLQDTELYLTAEADGRLSVRKPGSPDGSPAAWECFEASSYTWLETPVVVPPPVATDMQLKGFLRLHGRSFGDDSGPRIVHGCTYFAGLCTARDHWDEFLRQLDRVAPYVQYIRIGWRINGGPWNQTVPEHTIDPVKQPDYEGILDRSLRAMWDRGIRACLTCCDMYNWSEADAERWFVKTAQIANGVGQYAMCINDGLNEMRGTHPLGESDEAIQQMEHLMQLARAAYPWAQVGISDPGSQDQAGMKRMSGGPATIAQIHDARWSADDAIRHAFNTANEQFFGIPIHQREPTGPNSPGGWPSGLVYQPTNDPYNLLAIYVMHVITGQASTYFSDPALINDQPLDSTWGLKELPALYTAWGIPENIGQGRIYAGHHDGAPLNVRGSHASRADGMQTPDGKTYFGVVSGMWDGQPWAVPTTWDAKVTYLTPNGPVDGGTRYAGQVVVSGSNFRPQLVRLDR